MNGQRKQHLSEKRRKVLSASPANNVGSKCIAAATVAKSIAPNHAASLPIVNGSDVVNSKPSNEAVHGDKVTQQVTITPNEHWYDRSGRQRHCDWCDISYLAKRSHSRFCSTRCRVASFTAERQAGESS